MAKSTAAPSREILEAALQGLESQRDRLEEQIAQVRSMIGGRPGRPANAGGESLRKGRTARKKRVLTPEARKRIAAAQKKRWAAFRKTQS
ncbi:MAG: hypothetical protein M3Y24_13235 [Acidobacteriota bacterium]|nr:hypothetical protein [Acidobacteriota bacterium]